MTDQRTASSVSMITPLTSSLTSTSSELSAFDLKSGQPGAFSQELKRASQRSESTTDYSAGRQEPSRDAVSGREGRVSESSRSTDESASRPDDSSRSQAESAQTRSQRADSSEQRADGAASSSAPSQSSSKTDSENDSENDSGNDSGNDDSAMVIDTASNGVDNAELAEANTAESSLGGSETLVENEGVKEGLNERSAEDTSMLSDVSDQLQSEATLRDETTVPGASDSSAEANAAAASNLRASAAVGTDGSAGAESEERVAVFVNQSQSTAHRVTAGEQLTPAELANRQAVMAVQAGARGGQSAETMASEIDAEADASGVPLLRPTGIASATGTVSVDQGALLNADSEAADSSSGSKGLPLVDVDTLQNAKLALQKDEQLQASAQEELLARKLEQQAAAATLVQSKQQAQQQAQSGVLASASADNGSQPPDNMFLSLPGGIVTAPVLQRTDAGGAQLINAPVNMPILQNDAEKSMASNIRWMVSEGVKSAVVNVTPSGMGPISVSIGVENDQMNVSIVALQGSTREALDAMLPRLREQLAAQGHDSVRVDISDGRSEESGRGYSEQFSDEQNDAESGFHSAGGKPDEGAVESNGPDNARLLGVSDQEVVSQTHNGQLRSSYDVYV